MVLSTATIDIESVPEAKELIEGVRNAAQEFYRERIDVVPTKVPRQIIAHTGPEGSGKSCKMTSHAIRQAVLAKYYNYPNKLYAFPGYEVRDRKGNPITTLLEYKDWIQMKPDFGNCWIYIDEAQNFFDSLQSNTAAAGAFYKLLAQRRRRNIGIVYTVQDWQWFNGRMRWLTHILTTCFDQYWVLRREGIRTERGQYIFFRYYDIKGFYTGMPWSPSAQFKMHAQPFWRYYESYGFVNVFEGQIKLNIKKSEVNVDLRGGEVKIVEGEEGPVVPAPPNGQPDYLGALERMAQQGESPTFISKAMRYMK